MLKFACATKGSDRVPRFSRFCEADNVRFVRFNMANPHIRQPGREKGVRRHRARRPGTKRVAAGRDRSGIKSGVAVAREDASSRVLGTFDESWGVLRAPWSSSMSGHTPDIPQSEIEIADGERPD